MYTHRYGEEGYETQGVYKGKELANERDCALGKCYSPDIQTMHTAHTKKIGFDNMEKDISAGRKKISLLVLLLNICDGEGVVGPCY